MVGTADVLEAGPVAEAPVTDDLPEIAPEAVWDEPTRSSWCPSRHRDEDLDAGPRSTSTPDGSGVVAAAESFLT